MAYAPPVATGGEAPLTITCTPPSGTAFSVGDSTVSCTVADALERTASCAFIVTVQPAPPAPRLSVTRIMAFGNSITEGLNGDTRQLASQPYPLALQTMLAERYYDQTVTVTNMGRGGERVGAGLVRLRSALAAERPELVLLKEGVNNVNGRDDPEQISDTLRDMIKQIRTQGAQVFVATLLPERPGGSRAFFPAGIEPANYWIRLVAGLEGVPVVDLYQGFGGSPDPYIGLDGLHPNEAGYRRIAELFFDAIRERFEQPPIVP